MGATSPGRWQVAHLLNMIDATSFANVGAACGAGVCAAVLNEVSAATPTTINTRRFLSYSSGESSWPVGPFACWPAILAYLGAPGAQEALIESDPKRYFRPPYVGHRGWVGVVLDTKPDWGVVAWLVEQAYRVVAKPGLVAKLGAAT